MPNNMVNMLYASPIQVSIHSFGELVDCLQLSLLPFSLTKLSLIIYIMKYLNGLPFRHSASHLYTASVQHPKLAEDEWIDFTLPYVKQSKVKDG
jgi:hypothetical protein